MTQYTKPSVFSPRVKARTIYKKLLKAHHQAGFYEGAFGKSERVLGTAPLRAHSDSRMPKISREEKLDRV